MSGADSHVSVIKLDPPPLRWTKRWLLIVGALLLVLAAAWIVWAHIAASRLQAQVDTILARHEPLYQEDLALRAVPATENAAAYLRQAIAALPDLDAPGREQTPSSSNMRFKVYPPFPAEWFRLADAAVAASARTLELVRQASACKQAHWGPLETTPWGTYEIFGWVRQLANVLRDAALDAHMHGDDAEAIARSEDQLQEAAAIEQMRPADVIVDLVAIAVEDGGVADLEVIAPDLRIGSAEDTTFSVNHPRPAARGEVEHLIGELLRDDVPYGQAKTALFGERANVFKDCRSLREGLTVLRPMIDLEAVRLMAEYPSEVEYLGHPAATRSRMHSARNPKPGDVPYSRYFTYDHSIVGAYQWVVALRVARRHMAAAALAARLFYLDHQRWPRDLAELVPDYLPAIPGDPTDETGGSIQYSILRGALPKGGDRPLIFYGRPEAGRAPDPPPNEPDFESANTWPRWVDLARWSP